jgi:pimeloyl-ACP methyl ester carboxylesterase
VFSAATQAEMQARLPGLTVVTVPGVGHAPTLAEPVAAATLQQFLNAIKQGEA